MKIATYNFLHGGSRNRNSHWHRLIAEADPDVVFCQEAVPSADIGGNLHWRAVPGMKWGSGIWIRNGKARRRRVPSYNGWLTVVESKALSALLVSVHCPVGEKGYLHSMHRILDEVKSIGKHGEVILAGDLNVAVGYRDHGDVVKMSKAERALLDRMRDELDLRSCWQAANPGIPLAQTLRWMRSPQTPYHCDGIFVSTRWISRLTGCSVLSGAEWNTLSDHNPVVAEFA